MKGLSIYDDKYPIIAINNKDFEKSKTFSLFHELAHLRHMNHSEAFWKEVEKYYPNYKECRKELKQL